VDYCLALIATRNFMPFAKLTARSFLTHHPEFRAFLLLVDGEPPDAGMFTEGHVVLLSELNLQHAGWYTAKLTASEFTNAVKPVFLRYLAEFAKHTVYLDCDIAVFSRLTEMVDLLEIRDLVLIPHMLIPPPRPEQFWTHPTRADIFNSGLINAGCFAINLAKCCEFLAFWEEANLAPGAFYEGAGYQTDQQHLNWALVMMPDVCVLRETRYNVAYWNLHDRDFRSEPGLEPQTRFKVDRKPLGFFHFSGYDVYEKLRLSRHDGRHSVYNLPAVAEILSWYSDQVLSCPTAGLLNEPYRFDRLANGFQLSRFVRELLKKYEAYIPRFDTHTLVGAAGLCAFLMDPLPVTGSMLPLVAAEVYDLRPDLQRAFPQAHTSISHSPYWAWFCRHSSVEYPTQFLVDRFRRALTSDATIVFAEKVADALGEDLRFLGPDRMLAVQRLQSVGENELADRLAEITTEWCFFSDLSAAFVMYEKRPDVQQAYPDILDADHEAFCTWLLQSGTREHGCPPEVSEKFRRCTAAASLARIFSYLSRREDVARTCQDSILLDDPEPVLRRLIRGAGEGLEYDLNDVIVLRFIHQVGRHLLVPLYLELPLVRQQPRASRVAEMSSALLPQSIRNTTWALRGCLLHATCFDRFESYLDEEIRRRFDAFSSPPREVIGYLRAPKHEQSPIRTVRPAYSAAARRFAHQEANISHDLGARLTERQCRPGVNIFGYFYSDIGVGESTRGLAQAVSLLRPVNRIPLCTSHLRDGTELLDLFQRFDYLSDTNVFVSYPHQNEDLLGMMRAEHLAGRQNIAHLAWEQKEANPWWKVAFDRYDEIWTISEFAASPFRKMFPGRIRVVPNVLEFDQFPPCEATSQARLKGDVLRFLFVFDANSSMERKNPEGVIHAFTKAFKDTRHAKRVQLTLKVGGMHRPEHASRVERLTRNARESGLTIHFDGRQLARCTMLQLIAEADCYVSLHRAEGFGYTMAEAMFYGVPVIASGYSGNLEYMTPENSFLVPCEEAFVKNADGPFQRGSIWGEPDIDIAATLMRHVAEEPSEAAAIGECGRKTVISKLSVAAATEAIRSCFVSTFEEQHSALETSCEPRD
jgi:glycosyltransferase involved in cell wall biosynthesis